MRILVSLRRVIYIDYGMRNVFQQSAVIALVVIHLGGSVLLPFSHQHISCGTSDGWRTIQSHDCGAKEVHKPIDDCRHCLLCFRDSTTVTVLGDFSIVPRVCVQPLDESSLNPIFSGRKHFSDPDRGPPTSPA